MTQHNIHTDSLSSNVFILLYDIHFDVHHAIHLVVRGRVNALTLLQRCFLERIVAVKGHSVWLLLLSIAIIHIAIAVLH